MIPEQKEWAIAFATAVRIAMRSTFLPPSAGHWSLLVAFAVFDPSVW
jgi:hypothetical protein